MEKELQRVDAKMKVMTDTILKLKEDKLRLTKELAELKKEQKKTNRPRSEKAPVASSLSSPVAQ
jgi:hypothetical protein